MTSSQQKYPELRIAPAPNKPLKLFNVISFKLGVEVPKKDRFAYNRNKRRMEKEDDLAEKATIIVNYDKHHSTAYSTLRIAYTHEELRNFRYTYPNGIKTIEGQLQVLQEHTFEERYEAIFFVSLYLESQSKKPTAS